MYIPNTCLAKHGLTYRYIHVQVIFISKFNSGEQYSAWSMKTCQIQEIPFKIYTINQTDIEDTVHVQILILLHVC
jgi:hypothetical protein